uniref:Vasohibin-1-like n=1 Tax=Phallusia mammillata TaxID=59560 RepID=A0A6F9DX32_9ASCI|nr:vasohibin-1-like [Phallusia mammillata]
MPLEAPPDEEDNLEEGNLPFFVNKNGFPVEEATWERMWKHASKIHPDAKKEIEQIKGCSSLNDVPMPAVPVLYPQSSVPNYLHLVQMYIQNLRYNHTGTQLFEIKKNRPLAGLMDTAKEMTKEALPIKCLEAVIVAIYLTNCLPTVERFPIGFKSQFNGHHYYHVVLGIMYKGRFGALGISRRSDLMDKPLIYKNLHDLLEDYNHAYLQYTHTLKKVRIGGVIPHDMCSQEKIQWGVCSVNMLKSNHVERRRKLERYGRDLKSHVTYVATSSPSTKDKRMTLPPRRENTMAVPAPNHLYPVSTRTTQSAHIVSRKPNSTNHNYEVRI